MFRRLALLSALALAPAVAGALVSNVTTRPSGASGSVQFNNGGVFGSSPTFTYDKTNSDLAVSTISVTFIDGSTATFRMIRWADGTTQTTSGAAGQYINLQATLQSGATFYTSSGTVVSMNVTSLKFVDGTSMTTASAGGGGGSFWVGTATSALNMGDSYAIYGATNVITSSFTVTGGTETHNGLTYNTPSTISSGAKLKVYTKTGPNAVETFSDVIIDGMRTSSTDTVTAEKYFKKMLRLPTKVQAGSLTTDGDVVVDTAAFAVTGSSGTISFYSNGTTYYVVATTFTNIPMSHFPVFNRTTNRWEISPSSSTGGGGGSGTPGGSDTQFQFNNAGVFGGVSVATFNATTGLVTWSSGTTHVNIASETLTNVNLVLNGTSKIYFGSNPGTLGQVMTSAGDSSAPTWETSSSVGYDLQPATVTPNFAVGLDASTATIGNVLISSNITANYGYGTSGIAGYFKNTTAFSASNRLGLVFQQKMDDEGLDDAGGFSVGWSSVGGLQNGDVRIRRGIDNTAGATLLASFIRGHNDGGSQGYIDFGISNALTGEGVTTTNMILRSVGTSGPVELTTTAGKLSYASLNITGTPDGTKFLRDDGSWQSPSGSGGDSPWQVTEQSVEVSSPTTSLNFTGVDFDVTQPAASTATVTIASGITRDAEWDTLGEIETVTGSDIMTSTETATFSSTKTYSVTISTNGRSWDNQVIPIGKLSETMVTTIKSVRVFCSSSTSIGFNVQERAEGVEANAGTAITAAAFSATTTSGGTPTVVFSNASIAAGASLFFVTTTSTEVGTVASVSITICYTETP